MSKQKHIVLRAGDIMVEGFHYLALFVIGATVVWSAAYEYLHIMENGRAELKDILLLFIYMELGAMIGIYFKTHRLPVQFLIYIALTALARHLVIDVQKISEPFDLWLIASISGAIVALSIAILILTLTVRKYGRVEDDMTDQTNAAKDVVGENK